MGVRSDHVPNLRDVGGMTTRDGTELLHGRLLRSAMPTARDIAPDGIVWPPALVIDLRSDAESESIHPLARSGARIVNLPLLSALRPETAPWEDLGGLYLVLLDDASMYLVELVREVGNANGPTLIHCAAGKDRTGVSIALLLRLVGVPRDVVLGDYMATAAAEQAIGARLRKVAGRRHRATLPPSFFSVSSDAIDGVLDVWDGHDGGVHGWFRSVGGDDSAVEQLRRRLIG